MIRENKKAIIIAAIIMLIPVIAGLLLWNRLPEQVPTHWNAAGEVDGYAGKAFAVFGLNGILYALGAICIIGTDADPKKANISPQNMKLIIGIIPLVSVFVNSISYAFALGYSVDVPFFGKLFVAIVFIVMGNYVPKMRQSYTLGIKLPWTLASEDNWNRTHRFSGWIFIICGFIMLADDFLRFLSPWMYAVLIAVTVVAPMVFSYLYYKKTSKEI